MGDCSNIYTKKLFFYKSISWSPLRNCFYKSNSSKNSGLVYFTLNRDLNPTVLCVLLASGMTVST